MGSRARLKVVGAPAPEDALREAVESFYNRGRARNLSHHTLRFCRTRLEAFTRYLEARGVLLRPEALTPMLIRDFLAHEWEHISAMTAAHSFITPRAFFCLLVRVGEVDESPMDRVEKVRVPRKVVATFSPAQVAAMLATCNGRSFNGTRLRTIILTLLDCGLRVLALCGLALENASWDEWALRVMGRGSKERVVPFGEASRQALMAYVAKRENIPGQSALFLTCYGDPMNRHEAHRIVRRGGAKAGITGVRRSPHTFRHTFAVMYLRNGGDAFSLQRLLGHSCLKMTRRHAELAQTDVIDRHRACSPGDRFLSAVRSAQGRRRLS